MKKKSATRNARSWPPFLSRIMAWIVETMPYWLSFCVLLVGIGAELRDDPMVGTLRNVAFDAFQRWHPREYQNAPVRILDIDDVSLEKLGQWPWPRTVQAEMVRRLQDLDVAAIVFDVVFAEPDRTSPARLLELWKGDATKMDLLRQMPDHDEVFAEAIRRGQVVTGFTLGEKKSNDREPAQKAAFVTAGDDPKQFLRSLPGRVATLPILEAAAVGNGTFAFTADSDGVIRSVPLIQRSEDILYPSLAAEALRVAQGAKNYFIKSSGAHGEERAGGHTGMISVRIGNLTVPVGPRGDIWLHYTPSLPDRYEPAWKLFEGKSDPARFKEHIVFVGPSAKGLLDVRFTPLGGIIPGVEVHAQLVEQMLQGSFLERPDLEQAGAIIFMVLMWLLLVTLLARLGATWSVVVGGGAVAVTCYGSWYAFNQWNLLLDPVLPSIMVMGTFATFSVPRYLQAEKKSQWIREAFASYVSPNLVQYIIDHPELLKLGGEKRECSFVMTDLAGFTSLMEKFDPNAMVALLNEYLDEMVKIAFSHEGTLDRIVGDAVAIIFSAPVAQPDHAIRAVRCARDMNTFSWKFARYQQQEKKIPFGLTRIGVNTGTVLVGNFGGNNVLDYRALGDAINTAARLESVNKQLGTRICVSGSTVAQCPDFVGRPAGELVLKGKEKGIETFELLTMEEETSPHIQAYKAAYQSMTEEDPAALAAFQNLAAAYPDDGLVRFHLQRLESGQKGSRVVLSSK
ncbi:MAG: adenylate/guanylate cyclase domain-containing protein [Magnetococcales bacterium]|nr:adenylate/guanylate cyclase domain-containing protein [Magnetococcales bacterium]